MRPNSEAEENDGKSEKELIADIEQLIQDYKKLEIEKELLVYKGLYKGTGKKGV